MHMSRDTHRASADNNFNVGRGDRGGPRSVPTKRFAAGMRFNCFTVSVAAFGRRTRRKRCTLEQMDVDSIRGDGLGPSRISCDVTIRNCVALMISVFSAVDDARGSRGKCVDGLIFVFGIRFE